MIGSVGGPGGRFLGLLPESKSLITMPTATKTGNTVVSRVMVSEERLKLESAGRSSLRHLVCWSKVADGISTISTHLSPIYTRHCRIGRSRSSSPCISVLSFTT